jgi:hypothetical protein
VLFDAQQLSGTATNDVAQKQLFGDGSKNLVKDRICKVAHLGVGAILDGVRREDSAKSRESERLGLRLSGRNELFGGDEHPRYSSKF